jgi:hypothetical protein
MFISQTLGGLDRDIIEQTRIQFFGFGLALGDEFRKLGEFAGGDKRSMELYQSFRDPHSALRLIRFRGHFRKGGYDVHDDRHETKTEPAELHRRLQGWRGTVGAG